ncbi:hypothetical protein M404DRAFT_996513 [Pisolithus tinctorius Marx 270]|uniref:Uncharacterized protein n=1 Tax=Pisolithus tinctorius Marx 270 TaxID=870435 RepID=A0A0C3PLP6_PISTI|nr:hypothetical protein M404DRAFT_996513 [Pisolithus tinctorius Marx 270]
MSPTPERFLQSASAQSAGHHILIQGSITRSSSPTSFQRSLANTLRLDHHRSTQQRI